MWPRAPEPPLDNALYVGIDVSQEHLDASIVEARGNLVRAVRRYDNICLGFARLGNDTQALGHTPSPHPVACAPEAKGIYHLGLLDFLLAKKART